MSTATPATKRQRRRYSCGPCKTLKIKCTLQTPCQACKKVGREDKCYEDPPRPPSSEEISISTRRKTLAKRKKQLAMVSEEKGAKRDELEDNSGKMLHKIPGTGRNCSESPSAIPGPNNITAGLISKANQEQDIDQNVNYWVPPRTMFRLTIDNTKDPGLENSYASNASVPGLFASMSSTSLSDNQGTASRSVSLSSPLLSHSSGRGLEDISLNPDVNNYEHRSSIQHQRMNENYLLGIQDQPLNIQNFYLSQPNMTITSPSQDQSNTRFHSNTSPIEVEDMKSKQVMFTFNSTDLNIFKSFLPAFPILEELLHQYTLSSSYTYYNILNIGEIFSVFKGFFNSISNLSSTDTIKIDKYSLKCISHFYGIMSIGYLLSGWENNVIVNLDKQTVIQGWINISSMIRRILVDSTKVSDILFSIEWYLIIRDFFTYNNLVLDDYSSFVSVLELLKLNKWILDTIKKDTNKISTRIDKDVARVVMYWIHLRIVDLEVPYIMLKGTFIDSTVFANSIVPDKQTFDFLFNDLTNVTVTDPLSSISFQTMRLYFNRTQYTASIKLFLKSYLEFFCDISLLSLGGLKDFKKKSKEPDFERTDSNLRSLVKNQFCQQAAIRWLSFMSIEFTHYFPSLRFASYLTSILNLFNHFNCLDSIIKRQTNNRMSLVDKLLQTYNYGCFLMFVRCLVFQGMFIMTLNNFKSSINTILNFREIFDIARCRFHDTFMVFWNSNQVHHRLYPNLPLFRNSFDLCHQMCRIIDNDTQFNLLDDFITYLTSEIPLYDYLTQNYFASPDNLKQYVEILWRLLTHLKSTNQSTKLIMSELLFLNMDLVNSRLNDLTGLIITSDVVDDFAKLVMEPNIHE